MDIKSGEFWNIHYVNGGNSGAGSYKHMAEFKAKVVNELIKKWNVESVIEFGCGDGNQLSLMQYPSYIGVDVSTYIIEQNKARFASDSSKIFYTTKERDKYMSKKYDVSVSMDVIFHLLEEDIFHSYMQDLFDASNKYVIIYASNHEEYTKWPEYRHRKFMKYVQENISGWRVSEFIPNKYPHVIGKETETSASDFYIFTKH